MRPYIGNFEDNFLIGRYNLIISRTRTSYIVLSLGLLEVEAWAFKSNRTGLKYIPMKFINKFSPYLLHGTGLSYSNGGEGEWRRTRPAGIISDYEFLKKINTYPNFPDFKTFDNLIWSKFKDLLIIPNIESLEKIISNAHKANCSDRTFLYYTPR